MCYSAEVSFGTWAFGMVSAFILWIQDTPIQSFVFPLIVTQMQLVEGLRWIHAVDERLLAVLGKLVLLVQPAVAFVEAKQYGFILPYVVIQAMTELVAGSRDLRFTVAEDGHFKWNWSFNPASVEALPYWIGLFLGTSFLYPRWVAVIMLGLLAYFYANHAQYNTYGSLWCVWVNLLWVYYLLRLP